MTTAKKIRGDSKLDALPPAQKEQLADWLTIDNLTYAQARDRVLAEFGVATTTSALCSFFSRVATPRKYARSREAAEEFAQLMEGQFDEATIKAAKQIAFDAITAQHPDLKSAKAVLKIVGDARKLTIAQEKLSLDARRVSLLEQKAAQADAASKVMQDATLTPAQREAAVKEALGLK